MDGGLYNVLIGERRMTNISYDPVHLEILRMAKELIMQEYIDIRSQDHNKWLVESDYLWRTQRLRLAYPTIPTPPTEQDIISRAQILLEFLKAEKSKKEVIDDIKPVPIESLIKLEEKVSTDNIEEVIEEEAKIISLDVTEFSSSTLWIKLPESAIGILTTGTNAIAVLTTSTHTENILVIGGEKSIEPISNPDEQNKMGGKILPSMLKRLEEIKNNWTR